MTPEQTQRLNEIRAIVNGSRYEQGRYYEVGGSSFGGGPKYLGEAGELLKEVLALVKSQEALPICSDCQQGYVCEHLR